jgi:hypothetical protein
MFIPRMRQIEQETITFRNFRIVVDVRPYLFLLLFSMFPYSLFVYFVYRDCNFFAVLSKLVC